MSSSSNEMRCLLINLKTQQLKNKFAKLLNVIDTLAAKKLPKI